MKINFNQNAQYVFYESEIKRALDWLYKIRDNEKAGWAWVQFISPNEQNTAEVICSFSENTEWLKNNPDAIPALTESIKYWLLDTSHAQISIDYIWVLKALQSVRECEMLSADLPQEEINAAIDNCIVWLLSNFFNSPEKGYGLGDNSEEISNVIRTALAVSALNYEAAYLEKNGDNKKSAELREVTERAINWLLKIQNSDGGWGNLASKLITQDYQKTHSFSYSDLKYQCDSNAASTGYVMLALNSAEKQHYSSEIRHAFEYLKKTQSQNGGWNVFTEMGVRNGERYTFRHFGTAWALQGILKTESGDYRDECVIHGFEYLSCLQDENYGGFKSSPDADNYTWATCNALSTINILKSDLANVHAKHFLSVVWDWWNLKKKEANHSFKIGRTTFAFNGATALLFCIVFSAMITLLLTVTLSAISPLVTNAGETARKFVYSVITVLAAVILGLPWIVYVKNIFKKDDSGWIDSIGWVYGIITGFVLVLYQFII